MRKDAVPRELRRAACDTMLACRCQAIDNNHDRANGETVEAIFNKYGGAAPIEFVRVQGSCLSESRGDDELLDASTYRSRR